MSAKLVMVYLEDRNAPAVFTVTSLNDAGVGTLRQAITDANNTVGADTINFAFPGAGVRTISPTSTLPVITEKVTIDATTQAGFSGVPVIELNGVNAGAGSDGLTLQNHTGSIIRGFTINRFGGSAITITGGGSHTVAGNFLGTNSTGTSVAANAIGVLLTNGTLANTIGGTVTADRNIIAGSTAAGIRIEGNANQNVVAGNFIGTNVNGTQAIANTTGLELNGGASQNLIGGFAGGTGNVIAGNLGAGIRFNGTTTSGNTIAGNRIGLAFNGQALANGGSGVLATTDTGSANTSPNTLTLNTINSNTGAGVQLQSGVRYFTVRSNGIAVNGGLGLDLAANANNTPAIPTISTVTLAAGGLAVSGTLSGVANTTYLLDFYGNSVADPSGFGEGQTPLTSKSITTDGTGSATFNVSVSKSQSGSFLTATATVQATNETSSFSKAVSSFPPPPPLQGVQRFVVGAGSGTKGDVSITLANGTEVLQQTVFDNTYTGGVRVAMADFNGDGTLDYVAGTGPGVVTRVRIFNGTNGVELFSIQPFESNFKGGVFVSAGDITGDGIPELAISPDEGGGPRIRVFNGNGFTQINDFFGIEDSKFFGGVRTAIGDLNDDGSGDLIVAAGFGGGPRVAAFSGKTLAQANPPKLFDDFFAFESTLRNGAYVAAGDINGDGYADLITSGGPGGGPRVQVLSGQPLTQQQTQTVLTNFFAGDSTTRGGVRVASRDLDADGKDDLITGAGPGGSNLLYAFYGKDLLANPTNPTAFFSDTFFGAGESIYVG